MKTKIKVLIHVIFWIYMLNQQMYWIFMGNVSNLYWNDAIIAYLLNLITFYSVYLLLKYFFRKKNWMFMVAMGILVLCVLTVVRFFLNELFWWQIIGMAQNKEVTLNQAIYYSFRGVLIMTVYSILVRFTIDWFQTQKLKAEMINQTQASELALLRSQVNPHFLFNTLNNIYSLVYKKSDDAPAAVMKLSSIMRYVLYDATADLVQLEKEVEYLNSFIELQKLRSHQSESVEFNVEGNISGKTIAPMLLIPFVENAFKHGSKNVHHPGIRILLAVDDGTITFEVWNHIKRSSAVQKDKVGGIGLTNIRRRLELLYKGRYNLDVSEDNDIYHIKLILKNPNPSV